MKLDLDKFGEIIDDFLTKNEVQMLITMPEGTQDAKVQDNTGLGPVGQFYFMLSIIGPIFVAMQEQMDIDPDSAEWAQVVDTLLDLVRRELLPEEET